MTHQEQTGSRLGHRLWLSAAVSGALLVAVVLPAEYGIDPTGFGGWTGLAALAQTAPEAAVDFSGTMSFNIEDYDPHAEEINRSVRGLIRLEEAPFKSETLLLTVDDLGELEYKFIMPQDATLLYSWRVLNAAGTEVDGDGVFFEFHGHPSSADAAKYPAGFEMGYSKTEGTAQNGTFTAPFPGYHGWYFMNLEEGPVTVELTVSGYYTEHKEMYRATDGKVITNVAF